MAGGRLTATAAATTRAATSADRGSTATQAAVRAVTTYTVGREPRAARRGSR